MTRQDQLAEAVYKILARLTPAPVGTMQRAAHQIVRLVLAPELERQDRPDAPPD